MKFLLVAVNAKFIHSNPALYSLRAYAGKDYEEHIGLKEFTINHSLQTILTGIYEENPDVIGISCYVWNIQMVTALLPEIKKLFPTVPIWLGGPEVSYDAENVLGRYPSVDGVMVGEGEETFLDLLQYYLGENEDINSIPGIVFRESENHLVRTAPRALTDLDRMPFLYHNLEPFDNRIIYYETSRGCPYRCSYCLSSIDKTVRLRSLPIVFKELQFFLDHNLPQVKFVDRTFNCNRNHAMEIWRYLIEHDNKVTNFHFEIEADILSEEEFALLETARPGLFQMEIGVQTTNENTLKEIRRTAKTERIRQAVSRLQEAHNIHIHLDLIAGLPLEDYQSFGNSFNDVYAMNPEQLQLGFLKVLKGSYMHEKAQDYDLKYLSGAPYEVLSTRWLSYGEVIRLKKIEEMVEIYYNSNQFSHVMPLLESFFGNAFSMYESLAAYYEENGLFVETPSRSYRYQVLLDYIETLVPESHMQYFREALTYDVYLRENAKSRPTYASGLQIYKEKFQDFYRAEVENRAYLPDYKDWDAKQLQRMTHMEILHFPVWDVNAMKAIQKEKEIVCGPGRMLLFDYQKRDPLTYRANTILLPEGEE